MIEQVITTDDGYKLQVYVWPNEHAKAWVHINHGMAEHALRYHNFASQLVAQGYAVVAHNHRGHGNSETTQLGCFAKQNGWAKVLSDVDVVRNTVCSTALPFYLFGHSMGSFIVQSYLRTTGRKVDGVILSGSNLQPAWLSKAGKLVAKIEQRRLGKTKSSTLLQFLSFGSFNQAFKPNRTAYDWLTRDEQEVDKYLADPLCGFSCSTGLWHEFLGELVNLTNPQTLKRIATNLPLLILGGTQDPVGMMGKGLPKLASLYKSIGQNKVTLKMYENARHEILNETNHQQVYNDIINWLNDDKLNLT
jgi:alpha-beta hydrolase superfamily lysophospholipase